MLKFILDRAKEKTTWLGLIAILTAAGVAISPEQVEAIATLGLAIAGAVGVFTKEKQ